MIKKQHFFNALISAFSVSVLAQVIGLVRQVLIAAYFGIGRGLDIYFMTYAIATLSVFSFGMIFDSVSIPHLVRSYEDNGLGAFKELTGSIFSFSLCAAAGLAAIFIAAMPVFTYLMAAGFSPDDKRSVGIMAFYFLPWVLVSMPYYALCSFYKSIRHFNTVFLGEVVISLASLAFLAIFHPSPRALPVAYFAGYASAFLALFCLSFKYFHRVGNIFSSQMKGIYRNFIELFGVNQIGCLSSIVERFFQSFLPMGGISVLAYSSQISTNISGVLSFRDIFLVPLSGAAKRNEKLERAIIGLIVISAPVMIFGSCYAREIIVILFKRGRFDAAAVNATASALSIYIFSLVPAVAGVPAFRMFQVIDRIKNTGIVYLFGIVNFAVFGTLFVFILRWGINGMAWTVVLNAYLANLLTIYLLGKNGVRVNMARVVRYAAYACCASLAVIYGIRALPVLTAPPVVRFMITGVIYVACVVLAYVPLRGKMAQIISGESEPA